MELVVLMRVQTDNAVLAVVVADVARHDRRFEDHESRLRDLEHLTAKVVGGALVGSVIGGLVVSVVSALL